MPSDCYELFITPLKQNHIISNKHLNNISLSCGIVPYKVKKSKYHMDVALPQLLESLIQFDTG